jgi:transcriptional regulator GlxA family with amidase domain
MAMKMFPNDKWTKEKWWAVDGQFWTASGACAEMDMMAHWVMENYGIAITMAGQGALDFKPQDIEGKAIIIPADQNSAAFSVN